MLEESLIVKLSANVIRRYEHNVDEGVVFLYDFATSRLWLGNESSNDILKVIDGQKTLKTVYSEIQNLFDGYSYQELRTSFDGLVFDLINKKFLEIVRN